MLVGSRWISFYVLSLMVGVQWILGTLYQVYPEVAWIAYGRGLFPLIFGYCTAVWLKAGELALRGRSSLGEGCFGVSKRNLLSATLAYCALYLPLLAMLPTDPRRIPLWILICTGTMLVLPYLLLKGHSLAQACISAREAVKRSPALVGLTLLTTGLLYYVCNRSLASGFEYLLGLFTQAAQGQVDGLLGEVLGWQVTYSVAFMCQLILTSLHWMLPGPAALWIYWKSAKQGAQ